VANELGVRRRLSRLVGSRRGGLVVVPVDDSLIAGPVGGLRNFAALARDIAAGKPDAVLAYRSQMARHAEEFSAVGWIMQLSASSLRSSPTRKRIISNPSEAAASGADAVAVHLNVSSRYETDMIAEIGSVVEQAHAVGLPVLIIAYPRTEGNGNTQDNYTLLREREPDEYRALLEHTVRLAVELGADVVKTQYVETADAFRRVVEVADGIPLLVAGGAERPMYEVLAMASGAMTAGASGVSFGRNVFNQKDVVGAIASLRAVVHDGMPPDAALEIASRPDSAR
jgi:DhnA family fructose-bisphosphate aldolase class Ia